MSPVKRSALSLHLADLSAELGRLPLLIGYKIQSRQISA